MCSAMSIDKKTLKDTRQNVVIAVLGNIILVYSMTPKKFGSKSKMIKINLSLVYKLYCISI